MGKITVTETFQDPAGNPLAGGYATFDLSVDISTASVGGVQVAAGATVKMTLDDTGTGSVSLWSNINLLPAGTVYFVTAYTALGQPVWHGEIIVLDASFITQEDGFEFLLEDGSGGIVQE